MTAKKTNIVTMALLFSAVFLLTVLTGCSDEQFQMEVAKLKTENEYLQFQVDSLQKALQVKRAQEDSVRKSLESLDMGL